MQAEAVTASRLEAEVLSRQEALRKEFEAANKIYMEAAAMATEANRKASIAKALNEQEERRLAALPTLAKLAQQAAVEEHAKRVKAEQEVAGLRQRRVSEEESAEDNINKIRQAISKQRLVNRIRAAEDARIAAAAVEAARQARLELAKKQAVDEKFAGAEQEAKELRESAQVLASQMVVNATAELTAKVASSTLGASQEEQALALAMREYELLKAQATRSADDAVDAQRVAYEDRARADIANSNSDAIDSVAAQTIAAKKNYTASVSQAVEEAKTERERSEVAKATHETAYVAAFTAGSAAVEQLKDLVDKRGEVSGDVQYATRMAEVSPERFLAGVAAGIQGTKPGEQIPGLSSFAR